MSVQSFLVDGTSHSAWSGLKLKVRTKKIFSFYFSTKTYVCLFGFVALRPMSTAMVIAGRSVHFTTLFPGQA